MKENSSKIGAKSTNSNDIDKVPLLSDSMHDIASTEFLASDIDKQNAAKDTVDDDSCASSHALESADGEHDILSLADADDIDADSDSAIFSADVNGDVVIPPELRERIKKLPKYSASEERLNVITHAFGAIVSVVAALSMIIISIKDFTVVRLIGSLVFGVSLVYLYVNSTLYHNEQNPIKRITRQKLDHSSINVLIAGSNTFFLVTGLHSNLGYILCAVNWGLSIISMILNAINVKKFRAPTMVIYILTGWLSIFFAHIILAAIGPAFWVLLTGGLFYTFGLIFYAIKKPYMHAVWHFFVLGGSISHIVAAFMILATV